MSVGKYSPTVSLSYAICKEWWELNGGGFGNGKNPLSDYDDDGYDSYGYNQKDIDRAGHNELDYMTGELIEDGDGNENYVHRLYDDVSMEWSNKKIGILNNYMSIYDFKKINNSVLKFSSEILDKASKLDKQLNTKRGEEIVLPNNSNHIYIHKNRLDDFAKIYDIYAAAIKEKSFFEEYPEITKQASIEVSANIPGP